LATWSFFSPVPENDENLAAKTEIFSADMKIFHFAYNKGQLARKLNKGI